MSPDTVERPERRKRLLQLGSAAAFLAVLAVAVLIVVAQTDTDGGDTDLEDVAEVNRLLAGIPQRQLILGDPGAPVTLVEFGDLQCPGCKSYSELIVDDVIESQARTGNARIEFRNFTIIDEDSTPAGAAALAAGEQGRGWHFVELFYRNQGIEHSGYADDAFLTEIAKGAGVPDIERWDRERQSERLLSDVRATTAEAERLGFEGTPTFAVQGPATEGLRQVDSPGSASDLEAALNSAR